MSADEPDAARADVVSAVRGTRRDFTATIETDATRDSVWQAWTDVRDWGCWDLGLREAGLDRPEAGLERDAAGTLVPVRGRPTRFRVVAVESGRGYAFETILPGARLVVERRFESEDGARGRTRLTHRVRFDGPLAALWSLALGGAFMRALPPTLERLAALARERDADRDEGGR